MRKKLSKELIISIITGVLYVSYYIYVIIMMNKGYVDTETGVFIYKEYYLDGLNMILFILSTPCFLVSVVAGIISIVNDFKINERKRAIIAIICVAFILVFNFGGIHILNKILEPPKDAKEKAEKCEQSTECYKNDEIVFCLYKNEKIKCPIVIVEDKIKEAEGTS